METPLHPNRNGRTSASNGLAMRCMNLQAALNVLHDNGALSGPQLGEALEVYPSTVKRLLETLEGAGLVESRVLGSEQVGRPPKVWALCGAAGYALGLHIDPTALRGVALDLSGKVCASRILYPSPTLTTETLLQCVRGFVAELTAELPSARVLGMGVGMTGVVDPERGIVARSAGLRSRDGESATDYPLRDLLSEVVDWPVHLGNDANVGALALFRRLARAGTLNVDGSLFYLLLSERAAGIGSGLIIGGRPYSGSHGAAGEVMVPGRHLHQPPVRDLWTVALTGNAEACRAVLEVRRAMIAHVTALCQSLDPDCVVLGGEFGALQPHATLFVQELLDSTPDYWGYLDEPPAQGVISDPLWPNTVAIGSAELVLDSLFCRPRPGEVGPLVTSALAAETA